MKTSRNLPEIAKKQPLIGEHAGQFCRSERCNSLVCSKKRLKLRKELGLLEGVAIITGIIIGSGIFVSPKGVLRETGSVGMSLLVWTACGLLTLIGAFCYAELGTSIPKSGGDYAYLQEAFGPLPAFLFLWDANLIFVPTTNAIIGLTFAKYVIQPLFPDCEMPDISIRLIAAASICLLTFVNCWNVKVTTKIQDVFMVTKIGALALVIVLGMTHLFKGNTSNFERPFQGSSGNPSQIAVSFYNGIFSFAGWNYLNFMTEELKNPYKNLPRAIFISIPLVTVIYVLANTAYLAVLSPVEMMSSDAIAVTFGNYTLNFAKWVMPTLVAVSAFGGLSIHIMTCSRLCFVGARHGQFPDCLSYINLKYHTPAPSLMFLGLLSLIYLSTSDIYQLIEYASFVESMFIMLTVSGMLYMRWKKPEMERPIKASPSGKIRQFGRANNFPDRLWVFGLPAGLRAARGGGHGAGHHLHRHPRLSVPGQVRAQAGADPLRLALFDPTRAVRPALLKRRKRRGGGGGGGRGEILKLSF